MAFPSDLVRTKAWGTEVLTSSDLHGQLDLIINWVMAALNATTGHSHDGTSNQGPEINITNLTVGSQAAGDLIYASSASAWGRLALGTAGKFLQVNSGATAPEWDTLVSSDLPSGSVIQVVNNVADSTFGPSANLTFGAVATGTTVMVADDTIPQNTEGDQFMQKAITPTNASNILHIRVVLFLANNTSATQYLMAGLFQDTTANALASAIVAKAGASGNDLPHLISFDYRMVAGTTSATTFKVRAGGDQASTSTFNGFGGARKHGGVLASSMTITEVKA